MTALAYIVITVCWLVPETGELDACAEPHTIAQPMLAAVCAEHGEDIAYGYMRAWTDTAVFEFAELREWRCVPAEGERA